MKRTPLKRKTPLRARIASFFARKPKERKSKKKTKHARRERSFAYMGWTKSQPCCVPYAPLAWHTPCEGAVEADHAGRKTVDGEGNGTRALDKTVIPMCRGHHRERHDFSGTFAKLKQVHMRIFLGWAIDFNQANARAAGIEVPNV